MSEERIDYVSMPRAQWAEFGEESDRRSARLGRALALLRTLEWSSTISYQGHAVGRACPVCEGVSANDDHPEFGLALEDNGHRPDCKLAKLLEECHE